MPARTPSAVARFIGNPPKPTIIATPITPSDTPANLPKLGLSPYVQSSSTLNKGTIELSTAVTPAGSVMLA